MNIPIKTNQLEVALNRDALAQKYEVFKVETSERYFSRSANILDVPLLRDGICAIYFTSGRIFYVLMSKSDANKSVIKETLLQCKEGKSITLEKVDLSTIEQRIVLSLLLNALSSYESDFLRFNNLTGHLYCFNPSWIKRRTRKDEGTILKIPCVELSITEALHLALSVRTFTSELLKSQIAFGRKKFEQYPQYTLAANCTLRRKLSADKEPGFILRQTKGDKTEIPFMDIQNFERFKSSKMGVVAQVLADFNEKYDGICRIGFRSISDYIVASSPQSIVNENKQAVKNLLNETGVKIVDYIGDDYSASFCENVKSVLMEKYGVEANIGARISKKHLNLCAIHNEAYYEGVDDPHKKNHSGAAVQHITLEAFSSNAAAAISTVAHELLIKRDIERGSFSLFDWKSLEFGEEISFGMRVKIADEDRFFFMKIKPDGSFVFEEQKFDMLTINEYTDCVNIFVDSEDAIGVVKYANGDINIIRDTSWFTIPEVEKIRDDLAAGNTFLRNKAKREELFLSITDIKMFDKDNGKYYFVGIIGNGMKTGVSSAANIRKIDAYKNAQIRFEELLPLMSVAFVRNGQLTVLPFPFKYLKEYIRALNE